MKRAAIVVAAALTLAACRQVLALPTMVRLGYPSCASCHISPQGGGLLNSYGRGIDQAQSFRGGEYQPSNNSFARALSWGGRITQDVRMVSQQAFSTSTGKPIVGVFRTRMMYRNATELGKGFRLSAVFMGENDPTPRPSMPYDHGIRPGQAFLSSALISYRPREGIEIAAGRDYLPSGVYVSDLSPFYRSRDRLGYYDNPTQVKMFLWGKRYQLIPFVFGPSGHETVGERETGGGTLAELDVLGKQRTVVGVNLLRGAAHNGDRRQAGGYVRLGFGPWGILAEHDLTWRNMFHPTVANFRQQTTYAQVFWAFREWLVGSLIGEHLSVGRPYREDLNAIKVELVARLSSQFTIGINSRLQKNMITGVMGPSLGLQLAMKTVN